MPGITLFSNRHFPSKLLFNYAGIFRLDAREVRDGKDENFVEAVDGGVDVSWYAHAFFSNENAVNLCPHVYRVSVGNGGEFCGITVMTSFR